MTEKNNLIQFNYSESCTGNLNHCDSIIQGYQYMQLFFIYSDNKMYWCQYLSY